MKTVELNQPYSIISKKTEKGDFSDKMFDNYQLILNTEKYTTTDGLIFQVKTVGYSSIPNGEILNFDNPTHYFYYIDSFIYDENDKELEQIPGTRNGMAFNVNQSISKAKKWLDKKGLQLISGKGYQHKST